MLHIIVPAISPRILYAFAQMGQLWGMEAYRICVPEEAPSDGPLLTYGVEPQDESIHIPCEGLLLEAGIRDQYAPHQWTDAGELCLFPKETAGTDDQALSFDLPAAVFYLLSGYEQYVASHLDAHGRYDLTAYPSADWRLDRIPWVHRWAERLWDSLQAKFPQLQRQKPVYQAQFTVDIDAPWKHRHKGLGLAVAGTFRDLLQGNTAALQERYQAYVKGQDPYHTFPRLTQWLPPSQSVLFCLLARHSPHDTRFTWRHRPFRQLIQRLQAQGYTLGIHPSYESYLSGTMIEAESRHLAEIIGEPVLDSRQHFLRYQWPDTYRHLLAAGIRADYSLCRYHEGGFPHGMARPFAWYDLLAEQETDLMLQPTILMDRTLQQYLQLSPEEALRHGKGLIDITHDMGGMFTLLLHNDSLSESAEWTGWSSHIRALIAYAQAVGAEEVGHDAP